MKLKYETALKLKEAGFPQGGHGFRMPMRPTASVKQPDDRASASRDSIYAPTQEELIEACGKERESPNHNTPERAPVTHLLRIGWSGEQWFARYGFYESVAEDKYGHPLDGWGDSIVEALAELWLSGMS